MVVLLKAFFLFFSLLKTKIETKMLKKFWSFVSPEWFHHSQRLTMLKEIWNGPWPELEGPSPKLGSVQIGIKATHGEIYLNP